MDARQPEPGSKTLLGSAGPVVLRPVNAWRARLLAAIVVPCLAALSIWQAVGAYRKEVSDTEYLVQALARVSEEHIAGVLRGIDQLLSEMQEAAPGGRLQDPTRALATLGNRMKFIPEIRSAVFIDAKGVMIAGTLPSMSGTDVHDREYFKDLLDDPLRSVAISAPLQSRVVAGHSVVVARPIRGGDGALQGVVAVSLDPKIFEDELHTIVPRDGGRATLIRDDGVILARLPDSEKWRGKSVADGEVMRRLGNAPMGSIVGPSVTDGRDRVLAYRHLENHPLVIVVGMSLSEALAVWRRDVTFQGSAALILALLTVGLAVISDRRLAERQRIQQALAASEARYRMLTEHSPVGVFQSDADGTCLYVNERWLDLAGRTREQMLGGKWCDVVHPDDRDAVGELWRHHMRGEGEFLAEMRLVRGDGSIRWVRGHAAALSDEAGPAGGLVGTIEDITAAKLAERRLRVSEEKFAKAFQASPDAMVISATRDGRYIELNDAFSAMLGYSRDEFMGNTALGLGVWAEPEDRARLVKLIRRDGQVSDFGTRLRRKDGSVLDVLISVQEVVLDDLDCLLFICRDVSFAKEAEARTQDLLARLDASNKELEQFAYVTSHDLQEPLRMIAGYAQLIERRYRGRLDADADEFIDFLVDGAKRMQAMIHDLLEYSRVERLGGKFSEFSMAEVLDDARSNLGAALAETGGRLEVGPMPTVVADRLQMLRLFQNLIGNALKYRSPERPPEVTVSAEELPDGWAFAVRDNGIGIDPSYFDRIFLVFQRLHTREHYDGTGIGLAICKKIVERHGGRIRVESTPGWGSTFSFTLRKT
ncbi:Putative signal transduction histidine kinase [Magnetospirillum sp. XM-1]|uniref:PAS domain S-box protein n=1 Tax=Magnetospirillum sp. XM-1 TaxID=1663591 RepID=UPI00073DEF02|nr:PAS domain S-box protein [Magnetospirillum sp. XM-1]CUW41365.1 Putative signal transduction histidine kinase [Magnetospirillum sp. XM-1]